MENVLTREEEKEIDKMFKNLETPLKETPAEEVIELTEVVEEPPIRSRKEILAEREKIAEEYGNIKNHTGDEVVKRLDELEARFHCVGARRRVRRVPVDSGLRVRGV